jgi:hypothetical protein
MRPPETRSGFGPGLPNRANSKIEEQYNNTPTHRQLQAARLSERFGLMPSTAALVADLAFTIGGAA